MSLHIAITGLGQSPDVLFPKTEVLLCTYVRRVLMYAKDNSPIFTFEEKWLLATRASILQTYYGVRVNIVTLKSKSACSETLIGRTKKQG